MQRKLPDRVRRDIIQYAKEADVDKVVLFGSRARGDHTDRSDVDLAVSGGDFDRFYWAVNEHAHTLLSFDIVEMERIRSDELLKDIMRDGVLLYEKTKMPAGAYSKRRAQRGMGQFLNPGNLAFQKEIRSEIYVDKTGLIEYTNRVFDTPQAFICNSRPRRFGKSYAADMLTAYYSRGCDSRALFENLDIGKSADFERYLNKANVIRLDIQWMLTSFGKPDGLVDYISKCVISELREAFPSVLPDELLSLPSALSVIATKTGERFVVIIDEWDVLIRDESARKDIQEEYITFLRGLFKGLASFEFIQLAYLTGILPIRKLKTQSALNNFDQFTMTAPGPLAPYIGFTEEEVRSLSEKYHQNFAKVRRWYDGYRIGRYHVYNPNAVVNLMLDGIFQSYWSQTGTYDSILPFIEMNFDGLKESIIEMLAGQETEVNTDTFQNDLVSFKDRDDVLTLLIHMGYLAYRQDRQTAYIPNEEIRLEFRNAVRRSNWDGMAAFTRISEEFLNAVLDQDEEAAAEGIEKIHEECASVIRYHDENSLSSVLAIAFLASLKYYFHPVREMPTGRGLADFVYFPKPEYRGSYPALVVELKWNKNAKTALTQIRERHYPETIRDYAGEILLVGMSYDKKTKEHTCRIETMVK